MPIISTLKSTHTRERRALIKEETEAQKLLQENCSNTLEDVSSMYMTVEKVHVITPGGKIIMAWIGKWKFTDVFEQNNDSEGAE